MQAPIQSASETAARWASRGRLAEAEDEGISGLGQDPGRALDTLLERRGLALDEAGGTLRRIGIPGTRLGRAGRHSGPR